VRRIRKTKIKWQRFHGIFINTLQLLNFKSKMQWTWYELCFQAWRLYYSWFPERIWWYGCCMVSLSCLWCPSIFRNVFLKCVSEMCFWNVFLNNFTFAGFTHCHQTCIKRCWIFKRIFWSMWKVFPRMLANPSAYAKVKKWIFDVPRELKLYNIRFSDSTFIHWISKP